MHQGPLDSVSGKGEPERRLLGVGRTPCGILHGHPPHAATYCLQKAIQTVHDQRRSILRSAEPPGLYSSSSSTCPFQMLPQ
ncbi:hypothetical protein BAE44_0019871 [Dichanthelium oligosanthes]|uniref:Uncharacterized protein n=1 Tax=Dichanthelium oligosanthes TaxID=888268 RepID=A0A1E5V1T2_9POAL|nr:hypothetical protein BAE44_0019871 [Dichanthelium oligosanthes]